MKKLFCFISALIVSLLPISTGYTAINNSRLMADRNPLIEHIQETNKSVTKTQASQIVDSVYLYSFQKGIHPHFVLGLIKAESSYNPKAKSSYGAKGLMQVVPRFHKDKLGSRNPYDIETNIEVGTTIIHQCLQKHQHNKDKALYCYSGGAGYHYNKRVYKEYTLLAQKTNHASVGEASRDSTKDASIDETVKGSAKDSRATQDSSKATKDKQYKSMQELLKDKVQKPKGSSSAIEKDMYALLVMRGITKP